MKTKVALAAMVLALAGSGACIARQVQPTAQPVISGIVVERIRDINLTEAQEAAIAGIRDEYAPKVQEALAQLATVAKEEVDQARALLTPDQLAKLEKMKLERKVLRAEGLALRIAHLYDIDLTDDEVAKITDIRKEFRPKIVKALDNLKGILTPEQAKLREEGLKAGKSRKEVFASLNLTDEQKAKVEAVGKEVRVLAKEEIEKMRAVLDPEQQEKLAAAKADRKEFVRDRIAFGIMNFKELNLTDQQKVQIEAIRMSYRPQVQEAGDRLRAIVREELAAIIAVLKT